MQLSDSLEREIGDHETKIIEIRRRIHENPELSYNEAETARLIENELRTLGLKVRTNVGGHGVVGLLEGEGLGRVVALRADMDALPIDEESDVSFKSQKRGVMHACGHDAHVAMLLGTAMLLARHKDELAGSVKFLFQPAEEDLGRGGAKPMIEDGALENPPVDYVFGLHIMSHIPAGTFALKAGPFMAAPDSFRIKIKGRGGHGSQPHETIDPILVSAHVITALQAIRSRIINQTEPFVLSIGKIESGTKDNVIPDYAYLEGTLRTLSEIVRDKAKTSLVTITESICGAFGATCEIKFKEDMYPITFNEPKLSERVFEILSSIHGTKTEQAKPVMGAEDFSRFLQKTPGVFYFLGTRNEAKGCTYPNHSSSFKVDEDVLKYGSVSLAKLAVEFSS